MNDRPVANGSELPPKGWEASMGFGLVLLLGGLLGFTRFSELSLPGYALGFTACGFVAGAGYLLALRGFGGISAAWRPRVFWGLAILARLLVLSCEPGDDQWRYLWEGRIQLEGHNPYVLAPDAPKLTYLQDENWAKISHRERTTSYPPGAQLIFQTLADWKAGALAVKILTGAADLLVAYFLLRMHTGRRRYRDSAWYAWNPLVIYCFAGAGHFDSLLILALVAAVWALHRADPMDTGNVAPGWVVTSGLLLGSAISLMLMPLVLIPIWAMRLRWRALWALPGLAIPVLLALVYGYPGINVFSGGLKWSEFARANDLLWWMFDGMSPVSQPWYHWVALLAAAAGMALQWRDWRRAVLWGLGGLLLFSPVLHPWYLAWLLPFAGWLRSRGWFYLSVGMFGYFLLWESGPGWTPWQPSLAQHVLVVAPVLGLGVVVASRLLSARKQA